jgi:3-methyladenine DNA glycosylase AlkD
LTAQKKLVLGIKNNSNPMNIYIQHITKQIDGLADKSKADWWNNYLKNAIPFIGVGIPDIRKILIKWQKAVEYEFDYSALADDLIRQEIAEYKLAGILIYQLFVLGKVENNLILDHIEKIFDQKYVYDWNTCDWLCVRVLTPMIDSGTRHDMVRIRGWSDREYFWHARAALVSFAQSNSLSKYYRTLTKPMHSLIIREERFAKTSVGWVMREISKFDMDYVQTLLQTNKTHLTKEVSLNALKYVEKSRKKEILTELSI